MLMRYEAFSTDEDGTCSSPWIMRLEMDEMQMVARNILDPVEIQAKLMANSALKLVECRFSDPGPSAANKTIKNLVMRLMFDAEIS
jgi:hypothetical protein